MTVQAQHDSSGSMRSLYRTPCAFDERCRTYMTHPSPGAGRLPTCWSSIPAKRYGASSTCPTGHSHSPATAHRC